MFHCSQQNFPCVPVFPKSISSSLVFLVPYNMLLFPCSQFYFPFVNGLVALFHKTPGKPSLVIAYLFTFDFISLAAVEPWYNDCSSPSSLAGMLQE